MPKRKAERFRGPEATTRSGETEASNSSEGTHTMKLLNIFKNFRKDEDGAVTVDWVVLTAAIVGLGLVVMTTVGGAIKEQATAVAGDVTAAQAADSAAAPESVMREIDLGSVGDDAVAPPPEGKGFFGSMMESVGF